MAKVGMRNYYDQGKRFVARRRDGYQPCLRNTLPSWEKEFCTKVGLFSSWPKFLEAKECIDILYPRVMAWNDEAGAEAFRVARRRFKAHYLGLPCNTNSRIPNLPSPEDCIDEIDWDAAVDPSLLVGIDDICGSSDDEDEDESAMCNATRVVEVTTMPVEEIKATGWDVEVEKERTDPLVGMIVGDGSSYTSLENGSSMKSSGFGQSRDQENIKNLCNSY